MSGLLGFSLIAPGLAFGQSWYAGVGAGQSSMRDETEALLGTSFDDTDTGWKVFGGYLFLPTVTFEPNAGIELGYVDFGRFTGTAPGVSDNWEATGINLSLVGVLLLEYQFSLLAKIGAARWDVDNRFTVFGTTSTPSETGTDFSFGVGAQYDFTEQVGAAARMGALQGRRRREHHGAKRPGPAFAQRAVPVLVSVHRGTKAGPAGRLLPFLYH